MLGWLAEVAQSLVAMLPVAGAVVVLIAAAVSFYGQFAVFSTVSFGIISYLNQFIRYLQIRLAATGVNRPFLVTLCEVTSMDTFLSCLISVLTVVGSIIAALVTVFQAIGVVLLAVYVYQKVKLFANMLAVKGANE